MTLGEAPAQTMRGADPSTRRRCGSGRDADAPPHVQDEEDRGTELTEPFRGDESAEPRSAAHAE